jgi:ABC-2 type transport system permease protein
MRREGSPWRGVGVVTLKELSDHLTSMRMRMIEWLVVLVAIAMVLVSIQQIREVTTEDPFLFLRVFTRPTGGYSFVWVLSILVPVLSIVLGFDLVNSEHNQRTLSRILSQPIYRDALLFGKFLAGLTTIGVSLVALWLLVIGLAFVALGVPPSGEEITRAIVMLAVTIIYAGVWLALAMMFSVLFRSPATAALCPLGLWLFLTFLWPLLYPQLISPFMTATITSTDDLFSRVALIQSFSRVSPGYLFEEIVTVILDPGVRSTQHQLLEPLLMKLGLRLDAGGGNLPLLQSLLIVWPQIVALIAGTIVLFVISYVSFQRQEVRA